MEDINFVNMHRYQAIEKVVYQKVKEWKPKTIVELGHGSGALTVAMGLALKEINIEGKIYSYDINGTSILKPFPFDLLLIDINNTWNTLYKILISNNFINNEIKNGAKILVEGGDPNHPRINQDTLDFFNKSCGGKIFNITHLGGSGRTSISLLEI